MTIYDAAMSYREAGVPLIIMAGERYGSGSSRDWAAKGTVLLGVTAVLARSFERIHRSNLIGMGILPLEFLPGDSWETWGIQGDETISWPGVSGADGARHGTVDVMVTKPTGDTSVHPVIIRLDTPGEWILYQKGGMFPLVLDSLLNDDR